MKILGVDPGETTGWAICSWSGESGGLIVESCGQLNGDDLLVGGFVLAHPRAGLYAAHRAQVLALMQILAAAKPDVLVLEDFVLRQMTTTQRAGISPHGVIHMIEVWLYEVMIPDEWQGQVIYQQAGQKEVVNNIRMQEIMPEAYKQTRGLPHARDAVRHCEVYRRNTGRRKS